MALIIMIKVVPSAGRQAWQLDRADNLKCYLKSPPEKGKANLELIKTLAHALKIPMQQIEIIAGASARCKKIKIDSDLTYQQVCERLGIVVQQKIFG